MLIRQTLSYLPSQLLGPLMQFAAVIALTHYLSPADYGLTMLIFTSQELIFLATLSWWTFYMLRYGGSFTSDADRARFRATEASVLLGATLLQMAAALVLIYISTGGLSPRFVIAAAAFVVTRSFLGFLSERARAEVRIRDFSFIQILAPFGGLCLSVLAMQFEGPRPGWVLAAFALVQGVVGLVIGWRMGVFARPGLPDRDILRASLKFGIVMILSGVLVWVSANLIRFVVQHMGGAEALGLLSVGWGLALRLAAMAGTLVTAAAYPMAVKAMMAGDVNGARHHISSNSALLMLVIAPAVAGLVAINEPMVKLLVAHEFQAMSIAILPAAILGAGIRNMRMHGWDQMYLLFEAQRPMLVMEVVEVVLVLVASIAGMHWGGVYGAVLANTAVAVLAAGVDYLYLRAKFGLHAPFGHYARIVLAALFMLGVLKAGGHLGLAISPSWGGILLAALAGATLYALALALLFPRERAMVLAKLKAVRAR